MSFYFTLILVTHKFVCCLLQFSSCCFNSDHGYWYSLHNVTNFGDLSSQKDFFATLAINFSHHNSLDVKKKHPKIVSHPWHVKIKMVARDAVLAYSVNTKCCFQFDEPLCGKGFYLLKWIFQFRRCSSCLLVSGTTWYFF